MIQLPHLPHKLLIPFLGLAILLTIIGGVWAFNQSNDKNISGTTPTVTPGNIVISGEITCLPHKGDGPHTMECAFGLRDDNNKHYALRGLDQSRLINGTLTVQTRVHVVGSIIPPDKDERYDIVGSINIDSIEVTEAAS